MTFLLTREHQTTSWILHFNSDAIIMVGTNSGCKLPLTFYFSFVGLLAASDRIVWVSGRISREMPSWNLRYWACREGGFPRAAYVQRKIMSTSLFAEAPLDLTAGPHSRMLGHNLRRAPKGLEYEKSSSPKLPTLPRKTS